ncbi:maltose operon protein MalM [Pasteurellaceae bacterium Macca]|nr:maltose operon protein MalM [Pasteurellaceae bacterium Macca]
MKLRTLLSLCLALPLSVQALQPTQRELAQYPWHTLALSQSQNAMPTLSTLSGATGAVVGYKIPANQGTLNITIKSQVVNNKTVFVPNVLVLDSQFNSALTYPAKQFTFKEERGLEGAHYHAELHLTPTANQDFIYLLVYTTAEDLQGKTTVTHPAKLLAKAKGNQPPTIADLSISHSNEGKITVEVDGVQSSQFIGLNKPIFESPKAPPQKIGHMDQTESKVTTKNKGKTFQKVETSTEDYFNQAVRHALKANDVNKALNLVNEAERLGLTQPRQIFLKQVAIQH